jgi:hypothetical protein
MCSSCLDRLVLAAAGHGDPLIKTFGARACLSVVLVSGGAYAQDASPPPAPATEAVEPRPAVAASPPRGVTVEPGPAAAESPAPTGAVQSAPAPAPPSRSPTVAPGRVATEAPGFGQRGQFTLLGGSNVNISSTSWDSSAASSFGLVASPQLDYFVVRNISIGLDTYVSIGTSQSYGDDGSLVSTKTQEERIGGRIGVNLPFLRFFSFYPRVAFGYESLRRDDQLVSGQSISTLSRTGYPSTLQQGAYLDVYAPLLIHPVSHFFMGFGAEFFQDFGNVTAIGVTAHPLDVGGLRTSLGAGFVVGGYWGGSPEVEVTAMNREAAASADEAVAPRWGFGRRRQVVFTNALVGSFLTTRYALTSSGSTDVNIGGAVDYFVFDHISLGTGAGISSSTYSLLDNATRNAAANALSATWLTLRLGVSIPMGEKVSVYPVVSIGTESSVLASQAAGPENERDTHGVFTSVFAPLLVHPVEHFFVGFGPSLNTDISRSVSSPSPGIQTVSNRETAIGAGLELGGWVP